MIIYIVYRTTNTLNGKYYIGKHKQSGNEFDGYLGSGNILKRAINKYGRDNFVRETLAVFECERDCYLAEKEILKECWSSDNCYNLESGGRGGKTVSDESRAIMKKSALERGPHGPHTEETKRKMSENHCSPGMTGRSHKEESKIKVSASLTGYKHTAETCANMSAAKKGCTPWIKGRKQSEDAKEKMRIAHTGVPWSDKRRAAFNAKRNLKD